VEPPPCGPLADTGEDWLSNDTYLRGIELFDHGYYWEAHEAWEDLWNAAGRDGPIAELLSGLIKLAAAAIKLRQANPESANRLATQAANRFDEVQAKLATVRVGGLDLDHLRELACNAASETSEDHALPERVVVVFEFPLRR